MQCYLESELLTEAQNANCKQSYSTAYFCHLQRILLLDEMQSEGLITSNLRPKPEDCGIDAKNVTAYWNQVHFVQIKCITV